MTITKAMTLDGGGGQVASILVQGTPGITVSAGANDVVIIRNLRINGLGQTASPGTHGIRYLAGASLTVDNTDIFGFANNGIDVALSATGKLLVRNSTFRNMGGNGVNVTASSGVALAQIMTSSFDGRSSTGFVGGGVNAAGGSAVTVSNSDFNRLAFGAQAAGTGNLSVDNSVISISAIGIASTGGSAVNVSSNLLVNNTTGFGGAGSFSSDGKNKVIGGTPGTPTVNMPLK